MRNKECFRMFSQKQISRGFSDLFNCISILTFFQFQRNEGTILPAGSLDFTLTALFFLARQQRPTQGRLYLWNENIMRIFVSKMNISTYRNNRFRNAILSTILTLSNTRSSSWGWRFGDTPQFVNNTQTQRLSDSWTIFFIITNTGRCELLLVLVTRS